MDAEETIAIRIVIESDIHKARIMGKKLACEIGFTEIGVAEIEIAISELGTNIIKHSNTSGLINIRSVNDGNIKGIEIVAKDEGCGMKIPINMLNKSMSTTNTLGIGLSGVQRLMDEFEIKTLPGKGTTVITRKWVKDKPVLPVHCSVMSKPKAGETLSGDAYFYKSTPSYVVFSVIDALGHGANAHHTSQKILRILENNFRKPLLTIIECCHEELKGDRGAAIALGMIDLKIQKFFHIGVGNVETRVYGMPVPIRPVSANGTLGMTIASAQLNKYPYKKGCCIIMFSDGISGKFDIEPATLRKSPQEICHLIFTNHKKDHDDATMLVIK